MAETTRILAPIIALSLASCGGGLSQAPVQLAWPAANGLKTPAVIAYDNLDRRLVAWPMERHGTNDVTTLSTTIGVVISQATGMVANGDVVTIASSSPPELLSYDIGTHATSTLPDPYGKPVDVAIDKQATLYALNAASVAVYPAGSSSPYELTCQYMTGGAAIAVDDEGDVFVNGQGPGPHYIIGVVEYPAGSSQCVKVPLKKAEKTYATGLGVDPKTDDLIVEDNPQGCAGGNEGVIIVYRRPYGSKIVARHNLHANCPGAFRLDARSSLMFFIDGGAERSLGHQPRRCADACVDQRSYPWAADRSIYLGARPSAVTTIPNTLPN